MKFDLIVVNGDSFSDGGGVREQFIFENQKEPNVFKIGWASFLSEKLNIPIINLAVGGTSNKSIINKTLRFLENDTFFYHRDCSYPIISNFNLKNYNNILLITQWSFFHRFPVYVKNEYSEITPNMYCGFKENLNDDSLFEKYKEYFDLKFGIIDNEQFVARNFVTEYFLYNSYLSNKKNVTHYNWLFVPFEFGPSRFNFLSFKEKVKSFPFKLINNDDIRTDDLKTVAEETNSKIDDSHYGLHSCKIMADRFVDYLIKEHEEYINNIDDNTDIDKL